MNKSKQTKMARWGLWMMGLAGLGGGALLGNTPTVLAAPTCYQKIECAQLPVSNDVCGDLCSKKVNCSSLVIGVWLGFRVEEDTGHAGYEAFQVSGSEMCTLQQKCKSDLQTECPDLSFPSNFYICENDGDPEWISAFDQGAFADACPG